jgi:hypothetical protein
LGAPTPGKEDVKAFSDLCISLLVKACVLLQPLIESVLLDGTNTSSHSFLTQKMESICWDRRHFKNIINFLQLRTRESVEKYNSEVNDGLSSSQISLYRPRQVKQLGHDEFENLVHIYVAGGAREKHSCFHCPRLCPGLHLYARTNLDNF